MAYDEKLAERARKILKRRAGYSEKKMFGGLCFLIHGNMCCGVLKDELMVRVDKEKYEKLLKRKHARQMDFTGKPMKGMLYISNEGCKSEAQLRGWLEEALSFVKTLPPKKKK